ncbi:MAG: hypothetical protein J5685_10610 [Clostridiales bacterium]|nr:hypothetical protein [Clostridiales bacterium]
MIHRLLADIRTRHDNLTELINRAERKISGYPEGTIRIYRKDDHCYYYMRQPGQQSNGTLLSEKDMPLVASLMQRSYLKKVLKAASEESRVLGMLLERYPGTTVEDIYPSLPEERKKFIKPVILPDDEYVKQWMEKPYVPKEFKEGIPEYYTQKGERVRSKSEQLIADHLAAKGIPYKYECPLKLKKGTVHPDFTILRVSDRKEIYLEHNGMMDKEDYASDKIQLINDYSKSGHVLGDDLFITQETSSVPLDVRMLDRLIEGCFR